MRTPNPLFTRYRDVEVFAVEDRSAQIVWRNQPAGRVEFAAGGNTVEAYSDGGPGSVVLDGLAPNMRYTVEASGAFDTRLALRTLPAPDGPVLGRIATISDLHLGEKDFGLLIRKGEDVDPANRHPIRASAAAVREALDWGAQAIMIKGDITHHGMRSEWELAEKFLADISVPVLLAPGNHDTFQKPRSIDALEALADIGHQIDGAAMIDVGDIRLVLADTTVPSHSWGDLHRSADAIVDAAGTWGGPVLVGLHHHLHRLPVPWFWPLGIPKAQADALLRRLERANPRAIVTSGHTHRNRRHARTPVPYTEVGSTKDYPGVWAGYEFTSTSVRQLVRRVGANDVLPWTDRCRMAVGGIWGMWSPGTLAQRCFVQPF